jgi:hypothetical protein
VLNELVIGSNKMKRAHEDEEVGDKVGVKERETDEEGRSEDGWGVDDGSGVEEDEDRGRTEDGVPAREVDETAGEESPWGSLDRLGVGTSETEREELPAGSWRLCSQSRFSSTS